MTAELALEGLMSDVLGAVAAGLGDGQEGGSTDTDSMRLAQEWLAELREHAGSSGRTLDGRIARVFEHMTTCADCELREHNDPDFCEVADAIMDGDERPDPARARPSEADHPFLPLSGSRDAGGVYQRCGVDGCDLGPDEHGDQA